jgi:hypothetical protein
VVQAIPYSGDPVSGFTALNVSTNAEHNCAGVFVDGPGGNPEGVCKSNPPVFPRQRYCTQISAAVLSNKIDTPCPLDSLHQTAVERKKSLDELQAALKSLKSYYIQAATWGGIPKNRIIFLSPDTPAATKPVAKARVKPVGSH